MEEGGALIGELLLLEIMQSECIIVAFAHFPEGLIGIVFVLAQQPENKLIGI